MEKLVKSAESQSNTLVKQMSSSNAKSIKVISPKTTSTLSSAISKAKATLKGFKGKQKATFEKRLKAAEQTLVQVKTYNTTITNGTTLTNQLTTFKKTFASQPFQAEKLWTGLKAKNDQFTKDLSKLVYKNARTAFATKYQVEVKKELEDKQIFYDVNRRIDSFMGYTQSNEMLEVWEEFYNIHEEIKESAINLNLQELLNNKWRDIYYPTMVAPEKSNVENIINTYINAYNARDAVTLVNLFNFSEEQAQSKQDVIDLYTGFFSVMPASNHSTVDNIEVEFIYNDMASAIVEITTTVEGKKSSESWPIYLLKTNGTWKFADEFSSGSEE
jgi:hypothetical protein